jgi:hypothetical protein
VGCPAERQIPLVESANSKTNGEPENKRMDLTKTVLATGTTAFAGHPQRWPDPER